MKVIFAAGGTGGHIIPALVIADTLKEKRPDTDIIFIGSPDGLEAKLVAKAGYPFKGVSMKGFYRKITPSAIAHNISAAGLYIKAGKTIKRMIKEFSPDIVVGTGGYVTGTVLKTAVKTGVKTALHESNSLPGLSVKMLSDQVDLVMLGSEDAKARLKPCKRCIVTGNPKKNTDYSLSREETRKALGLPERFTVLSVGGSQGAAKLNEAIAKLLKTEQDNGNINHIHGFGKHGRDDFLSNVRAAGADPAHTGFILKEYIDNMNECMHAADLIITRAGAMTLSEIAAVGRASVTVPYPYAAENHQYYNALTLQNAGASVIIEDKDLTAEGLWSVISELMANPEKQAQMERASSTFAVKDAAEKIVAELIDLVE